MGCDRCIRREEEGGKREEGVGEGGKGYLGRREVFGGGGKGDLRGERKRFF